MKKARRRLLKGAAALAAAPYVITARSQETLIVNTQGGEYQELVERVVIRPFEKKFGVKVIHDATGTASQDYAKIRASRGAPGFDVAGLLTPPEVILGVKEGLLEKRIYCRSNASFLVPGDDSDGNVARFLGAS